MAIFRLRHRDERTGGDETLARAGVADPRVCELEAQARALGFALVPLDLGRNLEQREATVSAAEERGREFAPVVRQLGHLAGVMLPDAANQTRALMDENAELRGQLAAQQRDFTQLAMWILLDEPIPETLVTTK